MCLGPHPSTGRLTRLDTTAAGYSWLKCHIEPVSGHAGSGLCWIALVDMRDRAVQGMADPPPDGRVDVVAVQVVRRDPCGLVRFGVRGELTADRLAVEAHVDRHPDLTVAVGDAMPGIAEYPD